jgi:hypothetical protein
MHEATVSLANNPGNIVVVTGKGRIILTAFASLSWSWSDPMTPTTQRGLEEGSSPRARGELRDKPLVLDLASFVDLYSQTPSMAKASGVTDRR